MAAPVLVLNCGSSSVKFAVLNPASAKREVEGLAEHVGSPDAVLHVQRGSQRSSAPLTDSSYAGVVGDVMTQLDTHPVAVGHRVVHGGEDFSESVLIDDKVLARIEELSALAPLHNPANALGIRTARALLPEIPHVAVFDTAFHQTMPEKAYRYAVIESWYSGLGVRRYGFHGSSHRFVSAKAIEQLGLSAASRVVVAHLGNGASVTAVRDGVSVDTSMGMTPLEGLVMGTRSGDIDPAVIGYVAERLGIDANEVIRQLNNSSGLYGVSGVSRDMREVIRAADSGNAEAALAIELFCYRLAKYIAAYQVPLGGLDAVVFTGGIGENSALVRSKVLAALAFTGIVEDEVCNAANGRESNGLISKPGEIAAMVIPTDEELMIARDTIALAKPGVAR